MEYQECGQISHKKLSCSRAPAAGQVLPFAASPTLDFADAEADFTLYENEDEQYRRLVNRLRNELAFDLPVVVVEKQHLPNFMFLRAEVVVVLGQDGLVANTAKYAFDRPIIGVNDPIPKGSMAFYSRSRR